MVLFIRVKRDALDQVEAGADILDVNMGVTGMDQTPLMERAIFELSMLVETHCPSIRGSSSHGSSS